jgi:hypothetical protein
LPLIRSWVIVKETLSAHRTNQKRNAALGST